MRNYENSKKTTRERHTLIYFSDLIVYAVFSYCEFAKEKEKPLLVYIDEFQIVVPNLFQNF